MYNNYFGNYSTYLMLKKILVIIMSEGVGLYNYNGEILTYKEYLFKYETSDHPSIQASYFSLGYLGYRNKNLIKINIDQVKVLDPKNINKDSLSEIRIEFTINKTEKLVKKLKDFWFYS